jgi:hypothetical protein
VSVKYGTARAMAWDRIHPRLTTRSAWIDHTSELPVTQGRLIRLEVDRLPGGHDPLPVWLWSSATRLSGEGVDLRRQSSLCRLDLEHTFRMIKQTLGWTRPRLRTPEAAGRCGPDWSSRPTLDSASPAGGRGPPPPLGEADRARPAHPRAGPPGVQEPPQHLALPGPCAQTQPARPGRPPGSKNRHPATCYGVDKPSSDQGPSPNATRSDHKEQAQGLAQAHHPHRRRHPAGQARRPACRPGLRTWPRHPMAPGSAADPDPVTELTSV